MRQATRDPARLVCCAALGLGMAGALLGCGDTVADGVYACTVPGQGTDCPPDWFCRTDSGHPAALRCHETAGPMRPLDLGALGTVCAESSRCISAHCSNGRCSEPGFAWIEPGTFFMGSPPYQPGRSGDEALHTVVITRPFLAGEHEVTQAEWLEMFPENPSYFASCGESCPVDLINHFDAMAYANARSVARGLDACYELAGCTGTVGSGCGVSMTMGRSCSETDNPEGVYRCTNVRFAGLDCTGYRLPSEAEWEYAARAGSSGSYPGVDVPAGVDCPADLGRIAWYRCNSDLHPHPVGMLEPNLWGLYDTVGNAYELVWDEYQPFDPLSPPVTDPLGPRETTGAGNGTQRGGSWEVTPPALRTAARGHDGAQGRGNAQGLRLVRTVVAAAPGGSS